MPDNWFLDDHFWRTFGSLMFTPQKFSQAEAEVDAIIELCRLVPGRALDLACGPGRHALPLAKRSWRVTAVDTSPILLEQGQQRAQEAGLTIDWRQQDMRELAEESHYDLVLCMWTSFGYFDDVGDDMRVLSAVKRAMHPDSVFVLDVVGKEYMLQHLEAVHLSEYEDGKLLIERPILVDEMRRFNNEWILLDGDKVERASIQHSVYTATELRDRLTACGFTHIVAYGGLHGEPYDMDS